MINKSEAWIIPLIVVIITLSLSISFKTFGGWEAVLYTFLAVLIVVLANIFAKKLIAYHIDSEIEMKVWKTSIHLPGNRKLENFPWGGFLPLFSKIVLFPFPFSYCFHIHTKCKSRLLRHLDNSLKKV